MAPLSWAIASIASALVHIAQVHASVTIYNNNGMQQQPVGTDTAASATATNSSSIPQWLADMPAFNSVVLQAPAIPSPAPANQFTLDLQATTAQVPGISIQQNGTFLGFSIEMSVATQVSELTIFFEYSER